jgi:hypothetical protein
MIRAATKNGTSRAARRIREWGNTVSLLDGQLVCASDRLAGPPRLIVLDDLSRAIASSFFAMAAHPGERR